MSVSARKGALNRTVQSDDSSLGDEEEPLLQRNEIYKTYKRRWYVLFLYSLTAFLQSAVWNTWGPITQSAEVVFGWKDSQIGLLANWGNIAFLITVFPTCYLMDTKGLRVSLLVCTVLLLIATGLRCITHEPQYATWLINFSAILNGVCGTVPRAAPAQVANTWFPPNQRTSATAVVSVFCYLGVAMAFVIGPQLVTSPEYKNETQNRNFTYTFKRLTTDLDLATLDTSRNNLNSSQVVNFIHIRKDIMYLMYYEFAAIVLLFLCSIFMPSKPPTPPSLSASTERVVYRRALLNIARNKAVWLIGLAYALPSGVYGAWEAVIDIILKPIGIGQTEIGWIGFYSIMAGCVTGLATGRFSDVFMRHMRLFVLVMFGVAGGSFVWFTLSCVKVIPISTIQVYLSSILGGMFLCGTLPLFYELGAESAFPVSEGVTGGFLTWLNNIVGILFLLLPQIPDIGTDWMNWTLVGSVALGLAFLFVSPQRYTRTDIDISVNKTETAHSQTKVIARENVYDNAS
ncbi:solute carrier family 49 member 4 homolog [Saccostrea echinata]|uniref:solute carrier family 49 member 4 homolog n=1 Tax=Saccostrea echinata TaxID=191078 RepID=UPI002A81171F|nr:solute carrier family 49 member 4 homolog [Saccostrea echinata]